MFDVKQHCQVIDCNRAASTKCFCCNKNICTRHFTEHIETVKAQIDPLANDVNSMREKIQSLNVEQITETSLAQLYQWKSNMHELIDEIFSVKTKEIMDLTEKNMNHFKKYKEQQCLTMITIQDAVRQLIEEDDVTFQQIQVIRKALAEVETDLVAFKNNFISINTKVFSQNLVSVSSKLSPGISVKQQPPSFYEGTYHPTYDYGCMNAPIVSVLRYAPANQQAFVKVKSRTSARSSHFPSEPFFPEKK